VIVLAVIFTMVMVGLELTAADFSRATANSRAIAIVLCGQVIVVPLVAGALVSLMALPPALAGGILLVAIAPIGTMSNFYGSFLEQVSRRR
jgi:BASS family bile acid:Na+ symporter